MKSQTRRRFLLGFLWGLAAPFLAWSGVRAQPAAVGERFHRETALSWRGVFAELFRSKPPRPAQYKAYPAAKRLALPEPHHKGLSLETAIKKRRSVRKYAGGQLSLPQLSQLLYAAQGITGAMYGQPVRAAPSAGALYPFEIYVLAHNIEGLDAGIYHYAVRGHQLELLKTGDYRNRITSAALQQDIACCIEKEYREGAVQHAPAVFHQPEADCTLANLPDACLRCRHCSRPPPIPAVGTPRRMNG